MVTKGVGKKLFTAFGEEPDSPNDDAIKVFLRMKPHNVGTDGVIEVLDSKTVLFKMPPEYCQSKKKLNVPDQYKYTFSHIFRTDVTQAEVFSGCASNHIKDLFYGQHCLLFTYGTTNAGKTFTVLGTGDKPGILPRTLTTVFKSIKGKEYGSARVMPYMFNSAVEATDQLLEEEEKFKQSIITWNPDKTQSESCRSFKSHTTTASFDDMPGESVFKEMQSRLTNDTSIVEYEAEPDDRFSIWVSFAEIYNEAIFDLLQPITLNAKRKQLRLAQDKQRNTYIRDLKHVFVQSEAEAYKVLMFGKNNLQVAATGMNSRSSRSHCIFTIKLLKCPNVENPKHVQVSSFSICDLAGAERQKKTLNVGLRLKESQNINCSLHVLSRCFTIIRENQMNSETTVIPFRDSKLTQLFQHALLGKESVTMVVNVNSEQHLCEETQHVLKASAIAKHIVVQPRMIKRPARINRLSSFSQMVMKHNRSTLIRWDSSVRPTAPDVQSLTTVDETASIEDTNKLEEQQRKYEEVLGLVESLREKVKEEKAKQLEIKRAARVKEDQMREDFKYELNCRLKKAKEENELDKKRAQKVQDDAAIVKEGRVINPQDFIPMKKAKLKEVSEEDLYLSEEFKDLQDEITTQQKQIDGLTDLVNIMREEKNELAMELTNVKMKLGFKDMEIANIKKKLEIFGEESALQAAYLALEKDMERKIKGRDVMLGEARDDLLEELRLKDEIEEELSNVEKELASKVEEIESLKQKIEDLVVEVTVKANSIDMQIDQIEELETKFERETKSLMTSQTKLEEELSRKNAEIDDLKLQLSRQLQDLDLDCIVEKEKAQLQSEVDRLLNEKNETSKKINILTKSHEVERIKMQEEFEQIMNQKCDDMKKTHLEELAKHDELIQRIKEDQIVARANIKEAEDILRFELKQEHDEEMVELVVKTSEESDTKIKNMEKEFSLEKQELEQKISELNLMLENQREIGDELKEDLQSTKKNNHTLESHLAYMSVKIENLEKDIDSLNNKQKESKREVSELEQSLNEEAQEKSRFISLLEEKAKENETLAEELLAMNSTVDHLKLKLIDREHDLACCQSEVVGYQKSVPSLEAEFERQQREKNELKRKCEDLMATVYNMEQEKTTFQINQKEIFGKYEEQLKKKNDENDTLKKEVARVTNTFYKSTPTPKKELEKQIEDLKKSLEKERASCQKLYEEKEMLQSKIKAITEGPDKENENVFETECSPPEQEDTAQVSTFRLEVPHTDTLRSRTKFRSASSSSHHHTTKPVVATRSATKTRTRRTKKPTGVHTIESSNSESDTKLSEKQQRLFKKKLFNPSALDVTTIDFDDQESDFNVPQDSPGTLIKRPLRSRNIK